MILLFVEAYHFYEVQLCFMPQYGFDKCIICMHHVHVYKCTGSVGSLPLIPMMQLFMLSLCIEIVLTIEICHLHSSPFFTIRYIKHVAVWDFITYFTFNYSVKVHPCIFCDVIFIANIYLERKSPCVGGNDRGRGIENLKQVPGAPHGCHVKIKRIEKSNLVRLNVKGSCWEANICIW